MSSEKEVDITTLCPMAISEKQKNVLYFSNFSIYSIYKLLKKIEKFDRTLFAFIPFGKIELISHCLRQKSN